MSVAQIILQQLGGSRFVAMTGAKNLVGSDKSLTFKVGANSKSINMVQIILMGDDTYKVRFGRFAKLQFQEKAAHLGVYADQLQDIFTAETGLYTKF